MTAPIEVELDEVILLVRADERYRCAEKIRKSALAGWSEQSRTVLQYAAVLITEEPG